MIGVLVADDNPVVRQGLCGLLELTDDITVLAQASDGRQTLELAAETSPDVTLLDIRMPVLDGLSVIPELARLTVVLVVTYSEDADVVADAIKAGAAGFLVHGRVGVDELAGAVRSVAAGHNVLSPSVTPAVFAAVRERSDPEAGASPTIGRPRGITPREAEVMELVVRGLSNREVAARLSVTRKTVKNHVNHIFTKLGVTHRAEAIAYWLDLDEAHTSR